MTNTKSRTTATIGATKVVEDTIAATKATVEGAVKAGQEAAAKNVEQFMALTQEQFEKVGGDAFKGFDDVAGFGKDNIDAFVAAGNVVTKGWQDLGQAWFTFAQGTVENGVSVAQAMMTAKTPREAVDLQNSYAKSAFDAFVAESSKLSELGLKVTNDAIAPISARVNATVEKFGKPLVA